MGALQGYNTGSQLSPLYEATVTNSSGNKVLLDTSIRDISGNSVSIDSMGQMHVAMYGYNDDKNSTSTPLLANGSFVGSACDIRPYAAISLLASSDANSLSKGIQVQYSSTGSEWHPGESYTYESGTTKFFTPPKQMNYYRTLYYNGASPQGYFHFHSTLSKTPIKWSSHNVNDNLNDEDDGQLVVSVPKLRTAQNTYISQAATSSGNAKISIEEFESGVSTNSNSQLNVSPFFVDEFGNYNHQLGDSCFKGAPLSIASEHHEIHCGDSYTTGYVVDLSNGASIDYVLITPDWGNPVSGDDPFGNQTIKVAHLLGELNVENEAEFWFYESPTITDNGTALTVRNRNRNSSNTDFLSVYYGATISVVGDMLEHGMLGSGKSAGCGVNRTDEWILKNNTAYLLRVTNKTTSDNYHTIRFQYYVHPGI